jgi:hypothetical protein
MPTREEEIAWAAGFFEGEGTVTLVNDRFTVALVNTDEKVIGRFDEVVALVALRPVRELDEGRLQAQAGLPRIAAAYNALDAVQLLAPWLSKRRLDRAFELTGIRFPRETLPI